MYRLLIVDDEPVIVNGLVQLFRSKRNSTWMYGKPIPPRKRWRSP